MEAIGITNNVLDTPSNPHNTGWYSIYDRPGEGGNAVFSAHVNYYPNIIGPFNQLAVLGAGAQIIVVVGGQELVYEVFSNQRYHVDSIPMGEILWPAVPPGEEWVTLITCGGGSSPPAQAGPASTSAATWWSPAGSASVSTIRPSGRTTGRRVACRQRQ